MDQSLSHTEDMTPCSHVGQAGSRPTLTNLFSLQGHSTYSCYKDTYCWKATPENETTRTRPLYCPMRAPQTFAKLWRLRECLSVRLTCTFTTYYPPLPRTFLLAAVKHSSVATVRRVFHRLARLGNYGFTLASLCAGYLNKTCYLEPHAKISLC